MNGLQGSCPLVESRHRHGHDQLIAEISRWGRRAIEWSRAAMFTLWTVTFLTPADWRAAVFDGHESVRRVWQAAGAVNWDRLNCFL